MTFNMSGPHTIVFNGMSILRGVSNSFQWRTVDRRFSKIVCAQTVLSTKRVSRSFHLQSNPKGFLRNGQHSERHSHRKYQNHSLPSQRTSRDREILSSYRSRSVDLG